MKQGLDTLYCPVCGRTNMQQPTLNVKEIALKHIKSEYHSGDVCMYDLLASLPADGLSIEEAFEVYIEAKKWADGDEFYKIVEDETQML